MNTNILAADSNAALVYRYANGRDEAAFAELVRRFGPMVLGVSRRLLAFREDADDATQLVFAELARRAGTIEDPEAVASWLHTITVRVAHRLRQRRPHTEPLAADPHDPRLTLDDLSKRSDLEVLSYELDQLPESWREPLILRYFSGLSNEAAATQLGTTVTALEGRLNRGRNSLRVRLLRRGVGVAGVLALVSPAEVASADEWAVVTDAAQNLSTDPATLTFLPPEPSSVSAPLLTSKAVLMTGAAAVVLAVLGGGRQTQDRVADVGVPISTVVADDRETTPALPNPTVVELGNSADSEAAPQPQKDAAARFADIEPGWRRESFMGGEIRDLIDEVSAEEIWKQVVADANATLFGPRGTEIRFVGLDEDGDALIDYPESLAGGGALIARLSYDHRKRSLSEKLFRLEQRYFDRTRAELAESSTPDWMRDSLLRQFGGERSDAVLSLAQQPAEVLPSEAVSTVSIDRPLAQTPRRLKLLSEMQAKEFLNRLRQEVEQQTLDWADIDINLATNRAADGKTIQSRSVNYSGSIKADSSRFEDANRAKNEVAGIIWRTSERILDDLNIGYLDLLTTQRPEDAFRSSPDGSADDQPPQTSSLSFSDRPILKPNHQCKLDVFVDAKSATETMASTLDAIRKLFGERRIKVFDINSRDGAYVAKYYGVRSAPAFLLLSPHHEIHHENPYNEMAPVTLYEQPLTTEQIVDVMMSNTPIAGAKNLAHPERFVPTIGVLEYEPEPLSDDLQPLPAVASPQPVRTTPASEPQDQRPDEFPLNAAGITDPNNPPTPAFWRRVIVRFQELVPDSGQMEFEIPKRPQAFMTTTRPWFNDDDPDAVAELAADVALLHQSMMVELARDRRLLLDGKAISLAKLVEDNPALLSGISATTQTPSVVAEPNDAVARASSANDLIPLAEGRYLIWFTQPGCDVCEAMRPAIEQVKASFEAGRVREFDISTIRGKAVAEAYGIDVFATPATIVTATSTVNGVARSQLVQWGRLSVEALIPMLTTNKLVLPDDDSWRTSGTAVSGREEDTERWKNGESAMRWNHSGGGFF